MAMNNAHKIAICASICGLLITGGPLKYVTAEQPCPIIFIGIL